MHDLSRRGLKMMGVALGAALLLGTVGTGRAEAARVCETSPITGTSAPEKRSMKAKREARRAWADRARSERGFNYKWVMAYKPGAQPTTRSSGKRYIGKAVGHPCRLEGPTGSLTTSDMTEAQRACSKKPSLATARRYGCSTFYPRGN